MAKKAAFNTKATENENKMLVTTGFITIPEFYRVIKVLRQSKQSINEMKSRKFSDEIAKLSAAPGNSSAPKLK